MSSNEPSKSEIRSIVRGRLRGMNIEDRRRDSQLICQRLSAIDQWKSAPAVLLFCPLADEPDITPLFKQAWSEGKDVLIPAFDDESQAYQPRKYYPGDSMRAGAFSIPEPPAENPSVTLNPLDLAVVPGVAFDLRGRRLGRGKGFYDRILATFSGARCGISFDSQILDVIPMEPHDVMMNCILTPTSWVTFFQTPDL